MFKLQVQVFTFSCWVFSYGKYLSVVRSYTWKGPRTFKTHGVARLEAFQGNQKWWHFGFLHRNYVAIFWVGNSQYQSREGRQGIWL